MVFCSCHCCLPKLFVQCTEGAAAGESSHPLCSEAPRLAGALAQILAHFAKQPPLRGSEQPLGPAVVHEMLVVTLPQVLFFSFRLGGRAAIVSQRSWQALELACCGST